MILTELEDRVETIEFHMPGQSEQTDEELAAQACYDTLLWVRDGMNKNVRRCKEATDWLNKQITNFDLKADTMGIRLKPPPTIIEKIIYADESGLSVSAAIRIGVVCAFGGAFTALGLMVVVALVGAR